MGDKLRGVAREERGRGAGATDRTTYYIDLITKGPQLKLIANVKVKLVPACCLCNRRNEIRKLLLALLKKIKKN